MTDISEEIMKLRRALADADRVICEAICFPSASLRDDQIKWLTDKIQLAHDRHRAAGSEALEL